MVATSSNNSLKVSLISSARKGVSRLPPVFQALFVQVLALGICYLAISPLNEFFKWDISPLMGAFALGTIALILSYIFNYAPWWHVINFVFAPALTATLFLQIAPEYFLSLFILMAMIYWSTFRSQVPLYLSSRQAWQAVAQALPTQPGFRFIDLGSGLGGLLGYLHQIRPDGTYHGIENAPLPALISWLRLRFANNVQLSWGNFWTRNLADYDVVHAYLSPVPMEQLWQKARLEMRPGSLLISNTFSIPGVTPTHVIKLGDFNSSTLYIWRM